ncbi:Centromere-binding protein 1 [Termitomyces sp. J132]|nr:Centromere-binding protein 1 [Termitomyces sp. J132]
MAPPTTATHDPALSHNPAAAVPQQPPQQQPGIQMLPADLSSLQGIGSEQLMTILRNLPGVLGKFNEGKEDAAQTLSNLSAQQPPFPPGAFPPPHPAGGLPGINDPGPSSHPRGPPNLGQLSAVALSTSPAAAAPPPPQIPGQPDASEEERRAAAAAAAVAQVTGTPELKASASAPTSTRGRGGRSATMGSDEWTRQRKDNHKEVERRRRGNINEGINELGRIVPNGSGEKAKGAILSRAVQYIHHLKENEARNIEKWTLEKLLMDQAMGDLQTQLEEMKKMWEAEREGRGRAEAELEALRSAMAAVSSASASGLTPQSAQVQPVHARPESGSLKRDAGEEADKDGKKQRVDPIVFLALLFVYNKLSPRLAVIY